MRVAWACVGMVAVCALGCGDRGVDKSLADVLPSSGAGGATDPTATATGGSAAPASTGGAAAAMGGQPGVGGHPNGCCFSPIGTGGVPGTGGAATGGSMGMAGMGMAGTGMPGTGGAGGALGGPAVCSGLTVGSAMTLAPAASGQAYVRCATLGPEQGWQTRVSPSGDRLAARTAAGTVRLISTSSWTEVAQLASPVGEVDSIAFSPDGTLLATLSVEMGEVAVWHTQDGTLQASYATPPASTVDGNGGTISFSPDGQQLVTSTDVVIDLATGTKTNWTTGAPDTTALTTNPENLGGFDSGGIPQIRFTAGDARLFIVTNYEIGNSPDSTRLELRDPATATSTVLFNTYSRALLGYAISDDGRYVARGSTTENANDSIYGPGLVVIDGTTGAQVAADPTATSTTVLAFSHDGGSLFVQNGATVQRLSTIDLHLISSFTWPSGATFVAVSPQEDLLATAGQSTVYIDPASGAVVRTLPFPVTSVVWTADGQFAVGSGDPAVLFHFWIESSGSQLCGPAAGTGTAPPISSLGTTIPPAQLPSTNTSVTSADGTITGSEAGVIHDHATNFYADALSVTSSGALLRQFGAYADGIDPRPYLAISVPDGAKAYTPPNTAMLPPGPDVAVWCR